MGRALIVSAGVSANEYLAARLTELGYPRPVLVPSAAEARRRMVETDFELIVVNAPLPDEFGHSLCMDAAETTDAGVLLLAKADTAAELTGPLSDHGVLLLSRPFSGTMFLQLVRTAAAGHRRLLRLREENTRLQQKLHQTQLICRAKCCLVEQEHITEAEAHRRIEKAAMDTRRSRAEVAQELLDRYEDD